MEKLYKAGKARCIGVSNWTIPGLQAMLKYAKVKPAINQVEIHPFFANDELIQFCKSVDILPVAYSPLGSQGQSPTTDEKIFANPELNAIAKKKNVALAQVFIAWGLQRGYAVLPKSSNPERILSNFQIITLSPEEIEAVNKVSGSKNSRFVDLKDTFGYEVWPEG
jgi:diketogulonate reductase-like aldo/keto reductase